MAEHYLLCRSKLAEVANVGASAGYVVAQLASSSCQSQRLPSYRVCRWDLQGLVHLVACSAVLKGDGGFSGPRMQVKFCTEITAHMHVYQADTISHFATCFISSWSACIWHQCKGDANCQFASWWLVPTGWCTVPVLTATATAASHHSAFHGLTMS
jgi:hypothetical protein